MSSKIIVEIKDLFDSVEQKNKLEQLDFNVDEAINNYVAKFKTEIQNRLSNHITAENVEIIKTYIFDIYNLILANEEFTSKLTIEKLDSKEYRFFYNFSSKLMNVLIYKCFELSLDFKYMCELQKLDLTKINLQLYNKYLQNLRIFDFTNIDSNLFPNIFSNSKSYTLFLHFLKIINSSKYKLSDVSYYYRKMYNDNLIIESCRAEIFKKWLYEIHNIEIVHSLKSLNACKTNAREIIYKSNKEAYL